VKNLLGLGNTIQLAIEYDAIFVLPFLMVYFEWLNLIVVNAFPTTITFDVVGEEFEGNMLSVVATLALGSRPRQGFARLRAKREARSHTTYSRECEKV
jgi:hypothetical protein